MLQDDPFADMVFYDGACQVCDGDMRKCDGKCMGMLMEPTYTIHEVSNKLTQEQFQELLDYYKAEGYVIPGVIYDAGNHTYIVIVRKPTDDERVAADTEAR